MAAGSSPPAGLLAEAGDGDGDLLCGVARSVVQMPVEADGEGLIGAGRHDRATERSMCRNGYRDRSLEPRKTTEKALVAMMIAVAVATGGKREMVGPHVGPGEAGMFRSALYQRRWLLNRLLGKGIPLACPV